MVHTSEFVYMIRKKEFYIMKEYFSLNPKDIFYKSEIFNGISIKLKETHFNKYIYIRINFIKLLDKFEIVESDLEEILNKLSYFSNNEFSLDFNKFSMLRIDYRYDYEMPCYKNREVYIKTLQKHSFQKYRYKIKENLGASSISFTNNSSKLLIYDKEREKYAKNLTLNDKEKNIVRFEYVLFNNHLRYKKSRGEEKSLRVYFREDKFHYYFDREVLGILRKGDYMKIYIARNKIIKSELKEKDKKNLIKFLIDISRSTIGNIKNSSKYSNYYYYKYLNLLDDLKINPLLIPKNSEADSLIQNPLNNYKENL